MMNRVGVFLWMIAAPVLAQHYPVKPVRLIVAVQPGGANDTQARLLGKKMQETMKQNFIVENRPGASSLIGAEVVARAPADGYTLLCASSILATNVSLYRKLTFDLTNDLVPVTQISSAPQFLLVHPSVPAASVKDLVALAKKKGGRLNAGSSGTGSSNHLSVEMFKQAAGIDVTHIAYKGSGPATVALMSGEVDFIFAGSITAQPHIQSRKVRPLAITSPRPSPIAPGVPTLASFYPGFEATNWYGLWAPAATPAAIVNRVSAEVSAALKSPEVSEFLARDGAEPVGSTPQDFAAFFRREVERYAKVIKASNIRVE